MLKVLYVHSNWYYTYTCFQTNILKTVLDFFIKLVTDTLDMIKVSTRPLYKHTDSYKNKPKPT